MCCFSRHVRHVSQTEIFARGAAFGRQVLVYKMSADLPEELAMILPLPVPPSSPEDAVQFIDLSAYDGFFDDLRKGFPEPVSRGVVSAGIPAPAAQHMLVVHEVGDFEASFVPSVKDFARLDPRFRLPDGVWEALPGYAAFGFAVFKLKAGKKALHPMAFEFPRRSPTALFFPTVHVHDGQVHEDARFDHALYLQEDEVHSAPDSHWERSTGPARDFVDCTRARGVVEPSAFVRLRRIHGLYRNADIVV
jgi:hypothetical protein